MKRKLAKQLDSALEALYNLRIHGTVPTEEDEANYQDVFNILYDDGLLESSSRGAEITAKGLAFMKKGGYITQWYKELLTLLLPMIGVIVGVLLTWLLSR